MKANSLVQKHNLFECIQCGICTGGCPVARKANLNIRKYMRETALNNQITILPPDELWSCTTCATCGIRCPKELDPYEFLIDIRSILIEDGRIAPTIRDALENTFNNGNPWGRIQGKRTEWTQGLHINHISQGAEFLYYVGCTPAYDPRVQAVARSFLTCLNQAHVDVGFLGDEEKCCGSEVYGMGEKGLFELIEEENDNTFRRYSVNQIVTTCPHAYHTFKNRYKQRRFEVYHHSQLLNDLVAQGQLSFKKKRDQRVVYHDPCYLGKQNGVYEEPRQLIEQIPGLKLIEFDRSRARSLCCEGGGGRMWIDLPGERLAEIRIREAVDYQAEIIAVACPFCLLTFEDAIKTTGYEDKIHVMDIAELASSAL